MANMKAKAAAMLRGKKKTAAKKKFVPFWLKNKKGMKDEDSDKEDDKEEMNGQKGKFELFKK